MWHATIFSKVDKTYYMQQIYETKHMFWCAYTATCCITHECDYMLLTCCMTEVCDYMLLFEFPLKGTPNMALGNISITGTAETGIAQKLETAVNASECHYFV